MARRRAPAGLRTIRKQRGLTQLQLAAISLVDQPVISALEGQRAPNPKWKTVDALVCALRVDPYDLFPSYARQERRERASARG